MFNISNFESSNLQKLLNLSPEMAEHVMRCNIEMNKPCLHLREVGISSKLISDWAKAGLINDDFNKGKWREFSLVEAIWVKFIEQLRYFGMTINDIKVLKKGLFPNNIAEIKEHFRKGLDISVLSESEAGKVVNEILKLDEEAFSKALETANYSHFDAIILMTLLLRLNSAFLLTDEGGVFVTIDNPLNDFHETKMSEVFRNLSSKSFALINIRSLFVKFFENEKLKSTSDYYFGLMSAKEREVIKKIRTGDYMQVTIKIDNGSIIQMRLTKKSDDAMIRKISRLLKRGDYKEIELISKDGSVVKCIETDIVKMDIKQ